MIRHQAVPSSVELDRERVPNGWRLVNLEDVCERPQYGYTASAVEQPTGPRFLRITDITDEGVAWSSVPFCTIEPSEESKYSLKEGDVLVARIGATTGKSYLVTEVKRAIFASYLIRIRVKRSILPEFLNLYMQSEPYWKYIGLTKGGRLKQGINIPVLNSLPIVLPPLGEQEEIVRVLSTMVSAQQITRRVLETTKDLRRTLFAILMRRNESVSLSPATEGSSEIGRLPEGWGVSTIGDLFDIQQGKALSPSARLSASPRPFLRTSNVLWGRVDTDTLDNMDFSDGEAMVYALRKDDLLVCEGGDIGRTAIWNGEVEPCYYQNHLHRLRPKTNETVPLFYSYWMDAAINVFGLYVGLGNRTTIPNLSKGRLSSFVIPVPPPADQRRIAMQLQVVDKKINAEEDRLSLLQQLHHTLLHELLSGRRRLEGVGS